MLGFYFISASSCIYCFLGHSCLCDLLQHQIFCPPFFSAYELVNIHPAWLCPLALCSMFIVFLYIPSPIVDDEREKGGDHQFRTLCDSLLHLVVDGWETRTFFVTLRWKIGSYKGLVEMWDETGALRQSSWRQPTSFAFKHLWPKV